MKPINEYFSCIEKRTSMYEWMQDYQYDKMIFFETMDIMAEEMITEAFKSEMLTTLAKEISKAEKESNQRKIDNAKDMDAKYGTEYGKHKADLRNFSSIFGPVTVTSRYGGTSKKTCAVKWADITDDDFVLFTEPEDKQLKKFIKDCYSKRKNALLILCKHDTKKIMYVVQAYKENEDKICYEFVTDRYNKGFNPKKTHAYKYSSRQLKAEEVLDLIVMQELDVYALEITKEMTQAYNEIVKDREEEKKGMINYDKESLKQMLQQQQARYKSLVREIKAKKLMEDPNVLYDEIVKVQEEATALVKEIISKPEFVDKFYNAADIMRTVSYCFESFYKYVRGKQELEDRIKELEQEGKDKEYIERYRTSSYKYGSTEEHILDAKKYIKQVQEEMKKMKQEMEKE